jgi:hypothetical protein
MRRLRRIIAAATIALTLSVTTVNAQLLCPCPIFHWECWEYIWPGIPIGHSDFLSPDGRESFSHSVGVYYYTCENHGVDHYE